MDVLHFSSSPAFSSTSPGGGDGDNPADLDISIEELALSMQHHLLGNDDNKQLNGNPVLIENNYVNGNQNSYISGNIPRENVLSPGKPPPAPSSRKTPSAAIRHVTNKSKYSPGSNLINGHDSLGELRSDQEYPRLQSKFYNELKKKYPRAFERRSSQESVTSGIEEFRDRFELSPAKYLVKTEEKENSPLRHGRASPGRRRSSLETARSYLSLSRQSLNVSSDDNKGSNSESESKDRLRKRLYENSEKMHELLHKPDFAKYRSQENLNSSNFSSGDYRNDPRHPIHRFSSMDNILTTSHRKNAGYYESSHDSAVDMDDNVPRSHQAYKSGEQKETASPGYSLRRYSSGPVYGNGPLSASDTENGHHHKGYHTADSDGDSGIGKYDLRYRHAASELDLHNQHRSGHTSVTSSSRKEALRLLQKKRESLAAGGGGGLSNGHAGTPRQNGPLKADHNIQPIKRERSLDSSSVQDVYSLQGARPKKVLSTSDSPPDYGIVIEELLQDTPIRIDGRDSYHDSGSHQKRREKRHDDNFEEGRQRNTSRTSNRDDESRGLTRSPSKCSEKSIRSNGSSRSVRFEDERRNSQRNRNSKTRMREDDLDDAVFDASEPKQRTPRSGSRSNQSPGSRPSSRNSYENPYADVELDRPETGRKKSSARKKLYDSSDGNGDLRHSYSDVDYESRSHSRTSGEQVENPYEELPIPSRSKRKSHKILDNGDSGYSNPHMDRMMSEDELPSYSQVRSNRSPDGTRPRSRKSGTPSPEHHPSVARKPPSGRPPSRPRSASEPPAQYTTSSYAKGDRPQKKRLGQPLPPPPPPPPQQRSRPPIDQHDAASLSSNPCIINEYDDSISEIDYDPRIPPPRGYVSDLERYGDLSGSRTSLASRSSVTDKIQSFGRAAKKKFSSLRRAVSLDRLDKADRNDMFETPRMKKSPSLRSLSSILGRKKESDYESFYQQERLKQDRRMQRPASVRSDRSYTTRQRSSSVTSPNYLRKVGRVLKSNLDGTIVIELTRPPSGPFGFYIARGNEKFGRGIFISRMSDGYPEKMYAGLMGIGDEILEINGNSVRNRSMDEVYDMMADQDKLMLKIIPLLSRKDW
ncbi:dentin sialophosphoprotein-like [Ptychodera flava]|uniref:dentin sialophosphoprotein-like n=1 Tax=Ptychodera flava TaxID=63121 RepID=UPI003969F72C